MMKTKFRFAAAMIMAIALLVGTVPELRAEAMDAVMEAATGSTLSISGVRNRTVHVREKLIATSLTDIYNFGNLALVSDEEFVEFSNLKMYSLSNTGIVYPFVSHTGGTVFPIYPTDEYIIEFDVFVYGAAAGSCSVDLVGVEYKYGASDVPASIVTLATFNVSVSGAATPADLYISACDYTKAAMVPSGAANLTLSIENYDKFDIKDAYVTLGFGESGLTAGYLMERYPIGDISAQSSVAVNVPVRIKADATPGSKRITVNIGGYTKNGTKLSQTYEQDIFVIVGRTTTANDNVPVSLLTDEIKKELTPGTTDNISITINNNTSTKMTDLFLYCVSGLSGEAGVTRNMLASGIEVDTLKANKSKVVKFPLTVAGKFKEELHELQFVVEYTDAAGIRCETVPLTVYVSSSSGSTPQDSVSISNIKQSSEKPVTGENLTLTFTLTNDGTTKLTDVKVIGDYSSGSYEPLSAEPTVKVGDIKAGASKEVSVTFRLGENRPKGLNSFPITIQYKNSTGETKEVQESIFILNVQSSADVGRPKLIVNDYLTDPEMLKAGEEFDFTFSLKNTHASKEATNIKITLSQKDGIFAPVKGSNIFYIESIPAGESVTQTIRLKTRADASTEDYDLSLFVEYDYPNMTSADIERGGISETNNLKMHVSENYRPVIENIYVDTWETVRIGEPADLSFEFYNMGKSTLGNVYITVEGDFCLANNSKMSYIGSIGGYGQEYVNPSIVPLVSGFATGIVTVHFEDSNGDEVTTSAEFSTYVEEAFGSDGGGMDGDPGIFVPGDFDDGADEEEKSFFESIPWWGWAIAIAVVAGGVVILTVLMVRKLKGKKQNDSDYQEIDTDDEDY